ncbi:DUF4381 domain-containing protein [Pelagicoccus mobilis]|uniref:DUF4381 domain-containing protein n=1 Tax=Pelagicoccus mobilis TaxID=415221 RepID=A0A934VR99_9BACT|nr:DUF4381 domain-containing protein [Pelagicoccus mobilis]MBK1877309.1 DUF4381 domain-containing protein [Pelagicoccus mobilis]
MPRWSPPDTWGNYSLKELDEVLMAEPISLFPSTPAWYWVLGFIAIVAVHLAVRSYLNWKRNKYRRDALKELENIKGSKTLDQLPSLLKRTAICAYGRESVASLSGTSWIDFLNRTHSRQPFDTHSGEELLALAYSPSPSIAGSSDLTEKVEIWIRHHD